MLGGLEKLAGAIENTRVMLGNIASISVVSVLLAERGDKQLKQLMRGKRR